MILPKLTQHQLEEIARRAEACLVHPYNVKSLSEMSAQERLSLEQSYEKVVDAFREFATPQAVLSLVQTIARPNVQSSYDFDHDLTGN